MGDIDLWDEPTAENSHRVYRALASFGAPMEHIDEATFSADDIVFQVGG